MSASLMLVLIAEPAQAERLSDLLADADLPQGWFETAIDWVGGSAPYASARERVLGRRPRLRFEVLITAERAATLEAEIARRLPAVQVLRLPLLASAPGG